MRRLHSRCLTDNTIVDQTRVGTPTLKNESRIARELTRSSLPLLESLVNLIRDTSESHPTMDKVQVFSEGLSIRLGSREERKTSQSLIAKQLDSSKSRDPSQCYNTSTRSDILTMFSDIHATFGLKFRTLTLASNILQKFIRSRPAQLSFPHGHALTFAVMSIACKINQVYCQKVSEMLQNYRLRGVTVRCNLNDIIQLQKQIIRTTNADFQVHSHYDLVFRSQFPERFKHVVELMAELGFLDARIYCFGDETVSAAIINTTRSLCSEEEFDSGIQVKRCESQFAIALQECEQKHPVLWRKYHNSGDRAETLESQ